MRNILLLKATNITYAEESPHLKERILNQSERLILKDINLHLYKGQILGILGDSKRLGIVKEIFSKTLSPTSGTLQTEKSILSLDVIDHVHSDQTVGAFTRNFLIEFMRSGVTENIVDNLKYVDVYMRYRDRKLSELSRRDIALLIIELSKFVNVDIVVFSNLSQYLLPEDKAVLNSAIVYSQKRHRGVLLLEPDIENIKPYANYFMWLSHGQVRYEGGLKQGVERYERYLRERSSIKNIEEEETFDQSWKETMNEYALFKHNMERVRRKTIVTSENVNVKKLVVSVVLFSIMVASALVVMMDISFTEGDGGLPIINQSDDDEVVNESDRTLYGLVTNDSLSFGVEDYSTLDIMPIKRVSRNTYNAVVQGGEYEVSTDDFIYFNPASLYQQSSLQILLPYTHSSFRDNYLFYSNYLNISANQLKESINYDHENNQRVDVSGIPITFHLNDDVVYGISFPSQNTEELIEEYELTTENPIFRLPRGYMILYGEAERWLYINR